MWASRTAHTAADNPTALHAAFARTLEGTTARLAGCLDPRQSLPGQSLLEVTPLRGPAKCTANAAPRRTCQHNDPVLCCSRVAVNRCRRAPQLCCRLVQPSLQQTAVVAVEGWPQIQTPEALLWPHPCRRPCPALCYAALAIAGPLNVSLLALTWKLVHPTVCSASIPALMPAASASPHRPSSLGVEVRPEKMLIDTAEPEYGMSGRRRAPRKTWRVPHGCQ